MGYIQGILFLVLILGSNAFYGNAANLSTSSHFQNLLDAEDSLGVYARKLRGAVESRVHEGDGTHAVTATFVSYNNVFAPEIFESFSQFQNVTGFDGSQKIRFGIFDYDLSLSFMYMLGSFMEIFTSDVIYFFIDAFDEPFFESSYADISKGYYERKMQMEEIAEHIKWILTSIEDDSEDLFDASQVEFFTSGLGAQAAAIVGRDISGIGVIVAHNPAAAGFSGEPADNALDKTDAVFVEAIHYLADEYGVREPVGHVDVFLLVEPELSPFTYSGVGSYFGIFSGVSYMGSIVNPDAYDIIIYDEVGRHLLRSSMPAGELSHFFTNFLPRAYRCDSESLYLDGECFDNFVAMPIFPIIADPTKEAGAYYHVMNSINLYQYFSAPDDEFIEEIGSFFPMMSFQILIEVNTISPMNEGLIDAKIIAEYIEFYDIVANSTKVYETEYQAILNSDSTAAGTSQALFTLPYSPLDTDHASRIEILFRYRATASKPPSDSFVVGDISVTFPVLGVADDDDFFAPPTMDDVTFHLCGRTFEQTIEEFTFVPSTDDISCEET